jgi:hypothetical protein
MPWWESSRAANAIFQAVGSAWRGDTALFQGFVRAPEDKKPSDPKITAMMAEGEFQVFLKKDDQGWAVARSGFLPMHVYTSDYQSVTEEDAPPWQLLNGGEMH